MILANQTEEKSNKKRTSDIEDYFATESIFHERVLHHFKNYRQEWRNKSTHDFRLFFGESEAFLAIVNVSAYSYVLLNQIIEKLAYQAEKEKLQKQKGKRKSLNEIMKDKSQTLNEKVVQLIHEFSIDNDDLDSKATEAELLGMLAAFISFSSPHVLVQREAVLKIDGRNIHIDLLLRLGGEKVIIELKRPSTKYDSSYEHQVISYLYATKIQEGILWIPSPISKNEKLNINRQQYTVADETFYVTRIEK